jgi:probable HAF family extracellular repeat protein
LGPGIALAASADGSVVAGVGLLDGGVQWDGFRWTEASGKQAIGMPASVGYGMGVSSDGSVIVGADLQGATRWTQATGAVPLGSPFPGLYNAASDVSDDGLVVVGQQETPPLQREQAFRWTQSTGMTLLGTLFGAGGSVATATSADGSVVVGFTGYGFFEAFHWTPSGGMVGLGDLPGGEYSSTAWDVSSDGSLIVGFSSTNNGFEAFVWDAANGMRNLKSVFLDEGLDLTGWRLTQAKAVSADGRTFAGDGINPQGNQEAWIASIPTSIPEPSTLVLAGCALTVLVLTIQRQRHH